MPVSQRKIEVRRGVTLNPSPSSGSSRRFCSLEASLRELETAIGKELTMAKLRAIVPSWMSPSRLDDRQVIRHIATMVSQGWASLELGQAHAEGITAQEGRAIIERAKVYLGVPYSQDVDVETTDNKVGTTTGIDCSHLISFATGLEYRRAEDIPANPKLMKLGDSESRQDGDIVVFVGGGHVVFWDASPPESGNNLLGATSHHGVTWLPMKSKKGKSTFAGKPVFLRIKR